MNFFSFLQVRVVGFETLLRVLSERHRLDNLNSLPILIYLRRLCDLQTNEKSARVVVGFKSVAKYVLIVSLSKRSVPRLPLLFGEL